MSPKVGTAQCVAAPAGPSVWRPARPKRPGCFRPRLSQPQRRVQGIRCQKDSAYPAPSQPTFCPLLQHFEPEALEQILLHVQPQIRGPAPKEELILIDQKQPPQAVAPPC